ncbi:unnamed protein product [Penicillium pancosmium]
MARLPGLTTGWMASRFVTDLLIDARLRGTTDLIHNVVGVASSTRQETAVKFIDDFVRPAQKEECIAHGSFESLLSRDDIDVVYISTPHSSHYENCLQALEHKKSILCEKVLTINATQARKILDRAKQENLFVMENNWLRFLPISTAIRKYIESNKLGDIIRVYADLSYGENPESWPEGHRSINPDLAGGCLLNIGIYSLTWVLQCLYHTLPSDLRQKPKIQSLMSLYSAAGVDETSTVIMELASPPHGKHKAHGIATTSFRTDWDPNKCQDSVPCVRILGSKAELQVLGGPASRPQTIRIIPQLRGNAKSRRQMSGAKGTKQDDIEVINFGPPGEPGGGRGMFWAADEVGRSLRDKEVESKNMPWNETLLMMEVLDEVRRAGGLHYPEAIEKI